MSEANRESQNPESMPAVEPSISPQRVVQLAGGAGGATAEEQQAMAVSLLKYQLVVGESASRIGAYAFSAAGIMQSSMDQNKEWTPEQHMLFQFLVTRIAHEQDKTEGNMSSTQLLHQLAPMLTAFLNRPAPDAPSNGGARPTA